MNFYKKFFLALCVRFRAYLGRFFAIFASVLRQIARYLPHHGSKTAPKTHPKSSHDKFKTASEQTDNNAAAGGRGGPHGRNQRLPTGGPGLPAHGQHGHGQRPRAWHRKHQKTKNAIAAYGRLPYAAMAQQAQRPAHGLTLRPRGCSSGAASRSRWPRPPATRQRCRAWPA